MKKVNNKSFIDMSNKRHNKIYDYSLVEYIKSIEKVIIICKVHGEFLQTPNSHLNGAGCPKCGIIKSRLNCKGTNEIFIKNSIIKHGDKYDYSLVDYKNVDTLISIICKKHGIFEQRPDHHLFGSGCPKCSKNFKLNNDSFIIKSNNVHNETYDYSLVDYKNIGTPVSIICKKHGIFQQRPDKHLLGRGCSICCESKGEKEIRNFLINNNITFIREKTFNDCRDKNVLPFDFYLSEKNICIEYDGIQHFKPVKFFGGELGLIDNIKKDKIKTDYCIKNNIKLIRIRYNENVILKLKKEL